MKHLRKPQWLLLLLGGFLLLSGMLGGCDCGGIVALIEADPPDPDAGWYVHTEIVPEFCINGAQVACDTGKLGECRPGVRKCVNGKWTPCESLKGPAPEICDGLDNDCDGAVDETLIRECPYNAPPETKNVSHCRVAKQKCENAKWGPCIGESLPREEICNGKDDDCDGAVDEWLPIQKIGNVTTYSFKGDPTHLYLVSRPSGYTFGWSELPARRVLMSRVNINGSRYGGDWVITKAPASTYGNIHGLTWTGKKYVITWDTDANATGDAYMASISASGNLIGSPVLLAKGGRMVNPYVASSPKMLGVIWQDYLRRRLFVQPFDHNLKPLAGPKPYPNDINTTPYPGLAVLDERIAVAFSSPDRKLWVTVLDKDGKEINAQTITGAGGQPKDPYLATNQDGYLMVWIDGVTSELKSVRLDINGKPSKPINVLATFGAATPILRSTAFGGVLAWVQNKTGTRGLNVGRIDRDGKLVSPPSFQPLPGARDYIALAWTDLGRGTGRGAVAWIDNNNAVRVAPLGCQPE